MTTKQLLLATGMAAATLALVLTNATGGVAGLAPVIGISAIVLATAAFVVSWRHRSFPVAGLLAASGIIFMLPALAATGYFAVIVFPGPILGVIFGLAILGLGVAKGIGTASTALVTAR